MRTKTQELEIAAAERLLTFCKDSAPISDLGRRLLDQTRDRLTVLYLERDLEALEAGRGGSADAAG